MKLEQLLEGVSYTLVQGSLELDIEDIIYDSRKAAPGRLFVCIVGTQRDSHDYAAQCVADGVTALVVQHDIDLSTVPGAAVLKVESSRYALALMSGNLFGNPSRRMTMIGVTGTKGKTTTTHMIKSVLEAAGRKVGMIGTNGIYFLGHHQETANTTPESYELQKTFREFLDAGCDTALMEVSSQGLMMDRVAGIHYDIGVFTNLSPDHIGPGEHKTFEEYRSWKGQLFKRCTTGVVNIDDENTEALLEGHTCKLVTYGCSEKADYRAGTYQLLRTHDFLGVQFHVSGKDDMDVKVNMPGEFSVYNALAALTVGKVLGLPDEAIHEGLGRCVVKGRVELVPISRKFTILLDYAHNEVSTESLLTTLRAYDPHRLVNGMSGYNYAPGYRKAYGDPGNGDFVDMHHYGKIEPGAIAKPDERRAASLGEFGGKGLFVRGHMWPVRNDAYEMMINSGVLTDTYVMMATELEQMVNYFGLSTAIYTQTTDVEHEINGLVTYDRRVEKMNLDKVREINTSVIEATRRK